jgi:hypothetical protein
VETLQKRDRHEDDNSLLSLTNLELSSTSVQVDPPLANPYHPSSGGKPPKKGRLGVSHRFSGGAGGAEDNYLLGGRELEGTESRLEVGHRRLEVEQSLGDLQLQLGGVGVRRRVVGDLVDGGHCEGWGCAGVVGRSGFVVGGGRSSSD